MQYRVKIKYLFYIGFTLMFLPAFVFFIVPNTVANLNIGCLYITVFLLSLLLLNKKFVTEHLKKAVNTEVVKIYIIYLLFLLLTSVVHYILGYYKAVYFYYLLSIGSFLMAALAVYILPSFAIALNIKFNKIIKIFYILICAIMAIGIIQYVAFLYNIEILYKFIDIMSNRNSINLEVLDVLYKQKRIYSVFSEPSGFGQFLFITMPIILNFATTKYKIFKNNLLDTCIKKSIIPVMVLCIILTKSPIYLILCITEMFFLLCFKYRNKIKKYLIQIVITFILACSIITVIFLNNQDLIYDTYLFRILKVILSFGSFDNLVLFEPSLATRLISYQTQIRVFLDNILFGVGFYNSIAVLGKYFMTSDLPLTIELAKGMFTTNKNMWSANPSIVYTQLAEIGLIGFSIYIYWQVTMFKALHFIYKRLSGIQGVFAFSMFQSLIMISVISFYNFSFIHPTIFVFFGIILMIVLYYKKHS